MKSSKKMWKKLRRWKLKKVGNLRSRLEQEKNVESKRSSRDCMQTVGRQSGCCFICTKC